MEAITAVDPPYLLVSNQDDQKATECPDYIANASERDRKMMSVPDSQYHRMSWDEVQWVIKTNCLDRFNRTPSDIRRYLAFNADIKQKYGSVREFMLKERLRWADQQPKDPDPFNNPDTEDIKILFNDWPYGIDEKIVHLVVWTKFPLEDNPETGELTPRAWKEIDKYVGQTFRTKVPAENVIWFKNWKSLRSVHAVDHFHIMLYEPNMEWVRDITKGDTSLNLTH